jgi:hypothetical protein
MNKNWFNKLKIDGILNIFEGAQDIAGYRWIWGDIMGIKPQN